MRCELTFRLERTLPAHVRSSAWEILSRIRSWAGYTIDTRESNFSEATSTTSTGIMDTSAPVIPVPINLVFWPIGAASSSCTISQMRAASQHDNAGSCLSLIVRKPKYPEIDSRKSDSAFPPKRLHVSPSSDRNPGAFSFRRARPVAFHSGAVPRSGHPGHLWKMCGGSHQQSHGTVILLRLSATPCWRSL
jgi:hypothetical protein